MLLLATHRVETATARVPLSMMVLMVRGPVSRVRTIAFAPPAPAPGAVRWIPPAQGAAAAPAPPPVAFLAEGSWT
eukprot:350214-Chlamydomonas_euryale.AAC.4